MRILIPHFTQVGELGGVQTVVETLARKFAANGHEPTILEHACDDPRSMPGEQRVKIRSIQYPDMPIKFRCIPSLFRSIKRFRQVCDECQPEVVNLHFPLQQTPAIVWAASMPHRWKLVVTLHHSEVRRYSRQIPQLKRYHERLFKAADVITCVDPTLIQEVIEMHPFVGSKIRLISNGVDVSFWEGIRQRTTEYPYVLFAGRLHANKGLDILLKAWNLVKEVPPDLRLVVAGDGEDRLLLESLASEQNFANRVVFIGRADSEYLANLYQHCICFVMPSRNEAHPVVLNEAMASGAACITTPVGAVPEVMGSTGWMVPVEDVEALAAKLLEVINLPEEKRYQNGQKAQYRIRLQYSWDNVYQLYLSAYQDALGTNNPKSQ